MTLNEKESKEVAVVQQQSSKALEAANAITITTDEELATATDHLSKMKTVAKMIKDRKEAITRPLMEALNSARDLFKPIESNLADAERIVKNKMLAYQNEQQRIADEATAKLATRVEKGTMKPQTALKKMAEVGAPTTTMQGKVGSIRTSIVKRYRVIDASLLPREFLVPDMGKITEALKSGQAVSGAEVYEEKVISAR